jgi:hypothetical protein
MRVLLAPALIVANCFGQAYGTWKMDGSRSTLMGDTPPKSLALRIEHHSKGEVFTVDRVEKDGHTTTFSIVLYFDGVARDFQQAECSGTQWSRRIDTQTVEIVRNCGTGAWTRFVRRTTPKSQLILEISEQRADGRRFDRRLIFEKQ